MVPEMESAFTKTRKAGDRQTVTARLSNAEWDDLAVLSGTHDRIGQRLGAEGKHDEAIAEYRASLAILERLAADDPGNVEWHHDLSLTHDRIGEMLEAQGKRDEALAEYRASIGIIETLADDDPNNTVWRETFSYLLNEVFPKLTRLLGNSTKSEYTRDSMDDPANFPAVRALTTEQLWKFVKNGEAAAAELTKRAKSGANEPMRPDQLAPDATHDLNAHAASLGNTFNEAAAILTEAAKAASDPLRRARRVLRSFERRRAKNPDLPEPSEVVEARSFVNRSNYRRGKIQTATP